MGRRRNGPASESLVGTFGGSSAAVAKWKQRGLVEVFLRTSLAGGLAARRRKQEKCAVRSLSRDVVRVCCLALALLPGSCLAATLNGTVLDDKGKAVGAIVTIHRCPTSVAPHFTESYAQTTAKDGTFSRKNLNVGSYVVCAVVPDSSLLDPCQWAETLQVSRLANANTALTTSLQLQPGATISIHVDDPDQAVAASLANNPNNALLVMGVSSPKNHFYQAWHLKSNGNNQIPDLGRQILIRGEFGFLSFPGSDHVIAGQD